MYNNILVPVAPDHQEDVNEILAVARRLLADDGKITLVGVAEDVPSYVTEYVTVKPKSHVKSDVKKRLLALASEHPNVQVAVLSGKAGVMVADLAETSGADLIIISSHRPGVQDYFLGSTASCVVRRAPCAVMVMR